MEGLIKPHQSIELLKELHILTRDGKLNQDSRRKLKQVYHLFQFIEPSLREVLARQNSLTLVDHGAGKSYLGFIIYDLFVKAQKVEEKSSFFAIEAREDLVLKTQNLAQKLQFHHFKPLHLSVSDSILSDQIPPTVDIVTALHACDTATDDAINFALKRNATHIVLVPCCQAELANSLKKNKTNPSLGSIVEIFRHSLHTREFGSHLTNVLRCLQLESFGYQVTVTELVGFEHSMKNELILATKIEKPRPRYAKKLNELLHQFGIDQLKERFFTPSFD